MRSSGLSRLALVAAGICATLALDASPASADNGFSQEAAAEALFREAAVLFDEGKTEEACAKFDASQQLDPALGTTLRLADCYDRIGRTATAWAAFQRAAAMANKQDQPEREAIANERAEDLYSRLSYLALKVSEATASLPGVEVTLNGAAIPRGTWGTPIPVDPGTQLLVVRAPGHVEWSQELDISTTPGTQQARVPALTEEPRKEVPSTAKPVRGSAATPMDQPEPWPEESSSTQRVLAYVSGGIGLAALGVGGYFTYQAYRLDQRSLDHCLESDPTACTSEGKSLRDDAQQKGNWATIAGAGGLALVGLSVVLFATAPSDDETAREDSLRMTARVGPDRAGLQLGGSW